MKLTVCSFLMVITLNCFAQEYETVFWEDDTSTFRRAVDLLREGSPDHSIAVLNERLQTDSLCPFLHLVKGIAILWDLAYSEDSSLVADIDRYIYLRTHSDEVVCLEPSVVYQLWEFDILNYERPRELGMKRLPSRVVDIVHGLNAYFKPGFNDHCYHWKEAVENGFSEAQFLVDKYCKGK